MIITQSHGPSNNNIAHISFLTTAITVTYNPISQIVIVFVEFYFKTQLCQFMINPNSVCNSFDIAMAMALLRRFKQYHHNLCMSFKSPTLYAYPDLSQLSWISHSYWPFEILSQFFVTVPKPLLTEFGLHHRLERCADHFYHDYLFS